MEKVSKLVEPVADLKTCEAHSEAIHSFGVFSQDQKENSIHYDKYSNLYDTMQKATGFNDPFELAKCLVEKVGLPLDAKITDFGCGTGMCGEYLI